MQVVMRYIFQSSLSWSEELARYIFVWQTWLGTSFAVKHSAHIRVEFIKNFMSESAQRKLDWVVFAIWIAFSIFLSLKSSQLTSMLFDRMQLSPAMRLPMAWAYLSVPVGCSLMSLRLFQRMILRQVSAPARGEQS
ncbi:MAG: TRAP transporter small permease [Synergistales bacterium]|nr:TRAP transporter small permease [Synergistales bacterium]